MTAMLAMFFSALFGFLGLAPIPTPAPAPATEASTQPAAEKAPETRAESKPATASAAKPASISPEMRAAFEKSAEYSSKLSGRAVLVMHRGEVLFESYTNGWAADRPHILASGTKSFSGVAAMAAVQDGLIKLDDKVSDTLTDWKADPRKANITVRQLLNLSSGLQPNPPELAPGGGGGGARARDPEASQENRRETLRERLRQRAQGEGPDIDGLVDARSQRDTYALGAATKSVREPGASFAYGPSHYFAFGAYMNAVLAKSGRPEKNFGAYLESRILKPTQISLDRFNKDVKGNIALPAGARLTAREWARFGEFVRLGGKVRQPDGTLKPFLDEKLLRECFKPSEANPAYGLTWWLLVPESKLGAARDASAMISRESAANITVDGKPLEVWMAAGAGKQRMYIIPALDLVVVRFAGGQGGGREFANDAFLRPIVEALAKQSTPNTKTDTKPETKSDTGPAAQPADTSSAKPPAR
ncbi:MAG: serine hydrolase [Planctomycetota bacterium]|nr:serine hydrolase [Planctomycetota bacterium]